MAIAYYVPREYGPPPPQEQNAQNNPQIIDLHNHHFVQDANNNNVQAPRQQPRPSVDNQNNLVSLFSGFVNEMMAVFRSGVEDRGQGVAQERNQQEPQRMRMRRPAAQNLPDLRINGNGQGKMSFFLYFLSGYPNEYS